MKDIRILFTGIGRRIELIQAFRAAALKLDINLKIYGADMLGTAPALAYCDYTRKVCGMKDASYIEQLQCICKADQIDLLIPTIDTDLLVLSENKMKFENTRVLVSSPDLISKCRDKNLTAEFFRQCECYTPQTFNDWKLYKGPFPCFIKPKDGSSSINTFKVNSLDDLKVYASQIKGYIIQPFIDGEEYTIDVFCDFEGNPIYITPRKRLQVRAGEVLKTEIDLDEKIISECRAILKKFKATGPITIQLIREKMSGIDYFIEINPRFGGGAPLSMKAGAKSAEVLLKLITGEFSTAIESACDGLVFSRFDQSVMVESKKKNLPVKGVIFDLDDTLYDEKEYVKSGFKAVAEFLNDPNAEKKMWDYFNLNKPAIDEYLFEIKRTEMKEQCLRIYREHFPSLILCQEVRNLIETLRKKGIKIGIITDGRPTGQRNKITALGLNELIDDIIITDEFGGQQFRKPCDISFRIIQRKWRIPFEELAYVGDNPNKDFIAPKQLGMQYLWCKNENGIYSNYDVEGLEPCDSLLDVMALCE